MSLWRRRAELFSHLAVISCDAGEEGKGVQRAIASGGALDVLRGDKRLETLGLLDGVEKRRRPSASRGSSSFLLRYLCAVLMLRCSAMHEVVRGPRAGELHAAVFELKCGRGVLVLIALHGLVVDKVGDIEKHLAGVHAFAGDLFGQRQEHAMHLDGEGSSLGLTLALTAGALAQAG